MQAWIYIYTHTQILLETLLCIISHQTSHKMIQIPKNFKWSKALPS